MTDNFKAKVVSEESLAEVVTYAVQIIEQLPNALHGSDSSLA